MQSVTEQTDFVLVDRPRPDIALVTLNRPERMNSMAFDVMVPLKKVLDELNYDNAVRVIVLTGAGRGFSSGADHKSAGSVPHTEGLTRPSFALRSMEILDDVILALRKMHQPVIAAVNGAAIGGGLCLALACDIRIASTNARFGLPETNLGILPGGGGTVRMARMVGVGVAKDMILGGRTLKAEEAKTLGLVWKVVEQDQLLAEATEIAKGIMKKGPIALDLAKRLINHAFDVDMTAALDAECWAFSVLMNTEDKQEGTTAFLEKRDANFKKR